MQKSLGLYRELPQKYRIGFGTFILLAPKLAILFLTRLHIRFGCAFILSAGSHSPVKLVEGALARNNHMLYPGVLTRAFIQIKISEPTTSKIKTRITAAQSGPNITGYTEAVALAIGQEKTRRRGAAKAGNIEQSLTILRPANRLNQLAFDLNAVASLDSLWL